MRLLLERGLVPLASGAPASALVPRFAVLALAQLATGAGMALAPSQGRLGVALSRIVPSSHLGVAAGSATKRKW